MVSSRGRGAVRVALGDLEYWICCSDPEHDQPRRAAALRADRRRPVGRARDALHTRAGTSTTAKRRSARHDRPADRRRSTRRRSSRERSRGCSAAGGFTLIALPPVVLLGGVATEQCAPPPAHSGVDQPAGTGVLDRHRLRAAMGRHERERRHRDRPEPYRRAAGVRGDRAVNPAVIPLQSFERVTPNPFGTRRAFYAGDTGGAIIGHHVDIYNWLGRAAQNAWGVRQVSVTPAPNPGTGNVLRRDHSRAGAGARAAGATACRQCNDLRWRTAATHARADREDPADDRRRTERAPAAVKLAIAAGNQIDRPAIPRPAGTACRSIELRPAYDCSGTTSYVLHARGSSALHAEVSGEPQIYGLPGPGLWITM